MKPNEKIMIYYMDKSNKVTQRIIRIIEIKDTHIIAYCYYRKQVRSFKRANILSYGSARKRVGA
ncbi:hypothetical protein GCM10026983_30320 [Gracilibacillus alcaliphilus]